LRSFISAAAPTLAVRSMAGMLKPTIRLLMDFFTVVALVFTGVSFLLRFLPPF
jgi:hypothetical protein